MVTLSEFLRRAAAEPFVYGETDCAMTLANWVREQTGVDYAAHLRGRYRTAIGWARIAKRHGGLVQLVGGVADAAGMRARQCAQTGDVGIVAIPGVGLAGGLRTARAWAIKTDRGITAGQFEAVQAWGF